MFEGFPYTNFHELNLDWIIKIAKDFLDQYTHIQQVIEDGNESLNDTISEGLTDLQTKATELTTVLDAWYTQHSDDISAELASAISDLNQQLNTNVTAFNAQADAKAATTIASIPDDYTTLSNKVINIIYNLASFSQTLHTGDSIASAVYAQTVVFGAYIDTDGTIKNNSAWSYIEDYIPVSANTYYWADTNASLFFAFYNASKVFISGGNHSAGAYAHFKTPANTAYVRISSLRNNILYINLSDKGIPCFDFDEALYDDSIIDSVHHKHINIGIGYFLENDGSFVANNAWSIAPSLAAVKPSTIYTVDIPGTYFVGYYDSNGTFINRETISNSCFITPANCHYIRLSVSSSKKYCLLGEGYITTNGIEIHVSTYAELVAAIKKCHYYRNVIVYIDNTITLTNDDFVKNAMVLCNNITIIGRANVKIIANYTGNNNDIKSGYSVFEVAKSGNIGNMEHSFTLIDVNIEASNIQYCVHDDVNPNEIGGIHRYIGCNFKIDNTNNNYNSVQCIGGGLGNNMTVYCKDSIFESVDLTSTAGGAVSYHNGFFAGQKSEVHVENCFFKGLGTFRFSWHGPSTVMSYAYVSNCNLGSAIIESQEGSSPSTVNTDVIEWNNVIR